MGMLEARERQPEVVEPMIEGLTRDRDAKRPRVGKVRQAHPARRVLLAENHIPDVPPDVFARAQNLLRSAQT
jgi:hypothetical protein